MSMQSGQSGVPTSERKKTLGIVKASINTQHMVKCQRVAVEPTDKDTAAAGLLEGDKRAAEVERLAKRWKPQRDAQAGEQMVFTVRDVRGRFSEMPRMCMCLTCQRTYKSEADMRKAHPEHGILVRQGETHVWCWWSDEPLVEHIVNPLASTFPPIEVITLVGLLSDE